MAARIRTIVGLALGLSAAASLATPDSPATIPQAVSPGLDNVVGSVATLCPTFSWAGVENAVAYELVIYDAGSDVEEAGLPAAAARVPGAASSWTPSLGQCLEPGRRYAWFVRAIGEERVGAWSEGRVFDVAAAPTIAEVEQALAILRHYLERGSETDELRSSEPSRDDAVASAQLLDEPAFAPRDGLVGAAEAEASGVEIADSAITIAGVEVVTTASDRDTLAALTCGDGQLAKWNAGLSQWECGDGGGGTAYLAGNQLTLDSSTFHVEEGPGSDLDADTLDGLDSSDFMLAATDDWVNVSGDTMTGTLTLDPASGYALESTADIDLGGSLRKSGRLFLHDGGRPQSTALGKEALVSSTVAATRDTAVGYRALKNSQGHSTFGSANTAVGADALYSSVTGAANTAVGDGALFSNTSGNNTAVGNNALFANTEGFKNTAMGWFALASNETGSFNTAVGGFSLRRNTTAWFNTAMGHYALQFNTESRYNTAVGFNALRFKEGGQSNTAVGFDALKAPYFSSFSYSTAVGDSALAEASGSWNIALGARAGYAVSTGGFNILIGSEGESTDANTIRLGTSGTHQKTYIAGISGTTVGGAPVVVDAAGRLGTSVFGSGSGLDADTLDDLDSTEFARLGVDNVFTGDLTVERGTFSDAVGGATLIGTNNSASADAIGVRGESTSVGGSGVVGSGYFAVRGETNQDGGFGLFGSSSADGTAYGIWGEATSQTAGSAYGVYGTSASSSGSSFGVVGSATASTGSTTGVHGRSMSDAGTGVSGMATSPDGSTFGVLGKAMSGEGTGVYGEAPWKGVEGKSTASSGLAYGLRGEVGSVLGRGVFGLATAVTGGAYGVYGESASSSGAGLYGYASAAGGSTRGVYGAAASPNGVGVYGTSALAGVQGEGGTYGVWGRIGGSSGRAVYGQATASTGETYGLYGVSSSNAGRGVYGRTSSPTGTTYGVYGSAASSSGVGVRGEGRYGVEGVNTVGAGGAGVSGTTGAGGFGVFGLASGSGVGVGGVRAEGAQAAIYAWNVAPGGTAINVWGTDTSGAILTGRSGDGAPEVFRIEGSGRVAVLGSSAFNAASLVKGSGTPGTLAAVEVLNTESRGEAGWFRLTDPSNPEPVVKLVLDDSASSFFLSCDEINGAVVTPKCHIDNNGTFHAGSDFAEALPAVGGRGSYAPGDVVLMAGDGTGIEKTSEPYSPRVAGVYSTRPGILGADKGGETRVDQNDVPVAIVGIVPTKVSAENGPISVGDLLVTSSTPGHAMRGTDRSRMQGAVVGKALEPFAGETGVIRVLVSLL